MGDTGKLTYPGVRGDVEREVRYTLDIRNFKKCPGFSLLLLAANPQLSVSEVRMLLSLYGDNHERSANYLYKRRWLFREPGTERSGGHKSDADGKGERAVAIMRANREMSIRDLVRLLKASGIPREREWVRRHRCD